MRSILEVVERIVLIKGASNIKAPLGNLGFISCATVTHIKHIPFYESCVIHVLSGRKILVDKDCKVVCAAGETLAVPAPFSYDITNEPDPETKSYKALVIPFKVDLLDKLTKAHTILHEAYSAPVGILKFDPDESLDSAIEHYLSTLDDCKLLQHRLMEILLIMLSRNEKLLSFCVQRNCWSQRVRTVLSKDLAKPWDLSEVCHALATSESTLRRNLRKERTSFRDILFELRISSALMQLLQTSLPIYRIAYDCGYQSVSRFTFNFRKRFGIPPTQFRGSTNEQEQNLVV